MNSIIFYPVINPALIVGLALSALFLIWQPIIRRKKLNNKLLLLGSLRTIAILILTWLLLQPEHRIERQETKSPLLVIAVDESASMTIDSDDNRRSRAEEALRFLNSPQFLNKKEKYTLEVFKISDQAVPADPELENLQFNQPLSNIHSGLDQIAARIRSRDPAGIILLSDGIDHSETAPGFTLFKTPLFIPELEQEFETEQRTLDENIYIDDVSYPDHMVKGWHNRIEVLLRRRGEKPLEMPLLLFQDGQLKQEKIVKFAKNQLFQRIRLPVTPEKTGTIYLKLELNPPEGMESNRTHRELMVEVTEWKNRILYLEGVPRWDFRFLRETLEKETEYQFQAFAQGAEGFFISIGDNQGELRRLSPAELNEEKLDDYGLIILGNLAADSLPREMTQTLPEYIENGGGLLIIGGQKAFSKNGLFSLVEFRQITPAMPDPKGKMAEGRFNINFTAAGRAHSILRDLNVPGIPPILSLWQPTETHSMATILASAPDGRPATAVRRFGAGRTAIILTDSLWQWQLRGSILPEENRTLYQSFFSRLVQWLAPKTGETSLDTIGQILTARTEYKTGEEIIVGADFGGEIEELKNEQVSCAVIKPDTKTEIIQLTPVTLREEVGLSQPTPGFRGRFAAEKPGKYQLRIKHPNNPEQTLTRNLLLQPPFRELTKKPIAREKLRQWAENSGGAFAPLPDWPKLTENIPYEPKITTEISEYSLWNHPAWLFSLILIFSFEWWFRGKLGMK